MSNLDWALAALDNPKPRKPLPVAPAPIVVPVPVTPPDDWGGPALGSAVEKDWDKRQAAKDPAAMLASALELVRAAGYRVTKAKAPKVTERPRLNCLGLPMSASYDPGWKRKMPLTSIARLSAPQNFPWVQS